MRGLRDLDAAALTLRQEWCLLLEHGDGDPREAVFATVARDVIEAAMARVDALVRPPDDSYFDEPLAQHPRVRRFLPGLVRAAQSWRAALRRRDRATWSPSSCWSATT